MTQIFPISKIARTFNAFSDGSMNQRIWSGLTAALFLTTLGAAPSSHADQPSPSDSDDGLRADVSPVEASPSRLASNPSLIDSVSTIDDAPSEQVAKVGEYQSQDEAEDSEQAIAIIQSHEMDGRQAATVYVRNIPVLTFISPDSASQAESSTQTPSPSAALEAPAPETEIKVASTQDFSAAATPRASAPLASSPDSEDYTSDPVWRATGVAARLNQLHRDNFDAEAIAVSWEAETERYVIKTGDEVLVEMGSTTLLPDTTQNPAEDALQITNRLRRQLGDAPPLREIEGRPQPVTTHRASLGPVQFTVSGMASWYGPGFNGRRSASGEIFNQNALTAAHRNLPFGTQVRVTNLNNGQSVVVRINDRGPYAHGRVIDLSAAAASAVGLIQSGVAPVSLDVLGVAQSASN